MDTVDSSLGPLEEPPGHVWASAIEQALSANADHPDAADLADLVPAADEPGDGHLHDTTPDDTNQDLAAHHADVAQDDDVPEQPNPGGMDLDRGADGPGGEW